MSFERRVAAVYLARLLTGDTAPELYGRRVHRVSFQQAPEYPVDDLVIRASSDDGVEAFELEIAVRRKPGFVKSDKSTEDLFGRLLEALERPVEDNLERRVAVCVAGPQQHAKQVSELADLARRQSTASGFFSLVRSEGRFSKAIQGRLDHLVDLVDANLSNDGTEVSPISQETLEAKTWNLLSRLEILMPRLEPPDSTDWGELLNRLEPWAQERSVSAAEALRTRLEALAASYGPGAANIDLKTLRRDAHEVLDSQRRRRKEGWQELRRLDAEARASVRLEIGVAPDDQVLRLERAGLVSSIGAALSAGLSTFVFGESGSGKSALVLGELAARAEAEPATYDVLYLNLRQLPPLVGELRQMVGVAIEDLLAEMSAPIRLLVLDGAEVASEREDHLIKPLLRAAIGADVSLWVISATEGMAAVRGTMLEVLSRVREIEVGGLEDEELREVASTFPRLGRLLDEPRIRELFRRPVVLDLFIRSGSQDLPFSEADAFEIVWSKLVRRDGRSDRGLPDARDRVMRQLAAQQLKGSDPEATYEALEPAAVEGLRGDGLLRPLERWGPLPGFAHEVLRSFATARVLLAVEDFVAELLAYGSPRWALPATRLAVQVLLSERDCQESPLAGRFVRLQTTIDRLLDAEYRDRWGDLPTEAVLTSPNSQEILADAWSFLVSGDAKGLRRLLRLIRQRHGNQGVIGRLVAEPVVSLLLLHGWPRQLNEPVAQILRDWLRGLVLASEPPGHALRMALRHRIVASVRAGDERLEKSQREEAKRLAARTPEEVAQDEARSRALPSRPSAPGGRSHRARQQLPIELRDDNVLEQLALLGPDLGEDGAALLRRVAEEAPHLLAMAVEGLLAGAALASFDTKLLLELVEAYYVDEDFEQYGGVGHAGIRHHRASGWGSPLAGAFRGPFLVMFRADIRGGVACLNRLLNHAARARMRTFHRLKQDRRPEPKNQEATELEITGESRRFYGDDHVWRWYRGTGVGPYPCMSALLALELVCDEFLKRGIQVDALVRLLLNGSENLAMPGLVVGIFLRHLEKVGSEIDPYLAEPAIWNLEFIRVLREHSGLAACTEGVVGPERRTWSLRDAAMRLTLTADIARSEELKAAGQRLVARAMEQEGSIQKGEWESCSIELAEVRAWAAGLDRDGYKFTKTDQGVLVEQVADESIVAQLASSNAELIRGQQSFTLLFRYPERYDRIVGRTPITREELTADLATARELADNPPPSGARPYDAPAAVAAAALEAHFRDQLDVSQEDLAWAAGFLVLLLDAFADAGVLDLENSLFGRGADRSAARALPLLALPSARSLRERLATEGVSADTIARSIGWILEHGANETRLFLARGFDSLWHTPCASSADQCHHAEALCVVEDLARGCLLGPWDPATQRLSRIHLEGPVAPQLQEQEQDQSLYVPGLSATIRGATAAAVSSACCRSQALSLLEAALAAHRLGLRAYESGYEQSADDALGAARAVLEIAASGNSSLLLAHIDGYADNSRLLAEALGALNAAGEESQRRAAAARRICAYSDESDQSFRWKVAVGSERSDAGAVQVLKVVTLEPGRALLSGVGL